MLNHLRHLAKTSFLYLTLLLGIVHPLRADEEPSSDSKETVTAACCEAQENFLDGFTFRAALLFLKPTVDQSSYVVSSTNNRFGGEVYPDGKRHLISPNFEPGFRLEGLHNLYNNSLRI